MEIKLFHIKGLLSRFDNMLLSGEIEAEAVRDVLLAATGIKIKKEDIKIKDNVLYVNIKPIYKSEIYLNKEKIFSLLSEALGEKAPKNIR
jgi:hypothetical protein